MILYVKKTSRFAVAFRGILFLRKAMVIDMTKKRFLLKMNMRLASVESKRRTEILNHYRTLIDQSIANGNTEESSVDSFGDVNCLCRLILKKEKEPVFVPVIFTVLHDIGICLKMILLAACICALVFISGVIVTTGYSLLALTLKHFIPSAYLISANFAAGLFKIGACIISGSILIIFFIVIKAAITLIVKIVVHIINSVKDAVYTMQSTKLMKEAFNIEAVN